MKAFRTIGVGLLLLTGIAIVSNPSAALAVPHRERDYLPRPIPGDWNTTYVAFELNGKSWKDILGWFADQTKMQFVSKYKAPIGTLIFPVPKDAWGNPQRFTLTEIYDIINERLIAQEKFLLIRGEKTLTMVPADEEIPTHLIPRVQVKDLLQRGRSEYVAMLVTMDGRQKYLDYLGSLPRRWSFDAAVNIPTVSEGLFLIRADVGTLRRIFDPASPK